ncbi:MAG: FG-GAP-like repeat-containing protein [Vicinamibacterales bacterium]|nr:FG-GAP-like repeat-containing protein [Vicinamibacterales bacterium]
MMAVSQARRYLVGGLLWLAAAAPVSAATVTLAWDPNPETSVNNYNVFVSTQPGGFGAGTPVGNRTAWTFTGLQNNVQYYFAVQAQSPSGLSPLSQIGYATPSPIPAGSDASRGDFNGDGRFDLVWKNQSTGQLLTWNMNGGTMVSGRFMTPSSVAAGWDLGGSGDFNYDGKPDLIWHNTTTGDVVYWLMDGAYNYSAGFLPGPVNPIWRIASIRDMDLDGNPDIWWRNMSTGDMIVWYFNGVTFLRSAVPNPGRIADMNWKLRGTADFTGDGRPDALWQHLLTGELRVWELNGADGVSAVNSTLVTPVAPAWKAVALGDADLDGRPDIYWQNDTTGDLVWWKMNGTAIVSGAYLSVPTVDPNWKIVGPK